MLCKCFNNFFEKQVPVLFRYVNPAFRYNLFTTKSPKGDLVKSISTAIRFKLRASLLHRSIISTKNLTFRFYDCFLNKSRQAVPSNDDLSLLSAPCSFIFAPCSLFLVPCCLFFYLRSLFFATQLQKLINCI